MRVIEDFIMKGFYTEHFYSFDKVSEAKWVYLTICSQSRYTHVPCRVYMHVPPRIRHGTCMYPDVYEGVYTCTPSYKLGYMYVPPRIRQGTCMYPDVYVRVHGSTQSFATGYLTSIGSFIPSDAVIVHTVRYLRWVIVPHWSYPVMQWSYISFDIFAE